MRRRCFIAHVSIHPSASVNLSLKSPGRMRMILRLFRPQCPLEAQREGRDLRDQAADMATMRGNRPLSNFDFRVQHWPTASSGDFKLYEPTTPITNNLYYSSGRHYGTGSRTTTTEASGALRPIRTSSAYVASPCLVVSWVEFGSTRLGHRQFLRSTFWAGATN